MLEKVILDADFCIKIGRFEGLPLLQEVIPIIARKAYIHRYVFEENTWQSVECNRRYLIDNRICIRGSKG